VTVKHAVGDGDEHLLRIGVDLCIARTPARLPVMGARKRNNEISCLTGPPVKRSKSPAGRSPRATGGIQAAARQNGLSAKTPDHHSRQRVTVRPTPLLQLSHPRRCGSAAHRRDHDHPGAPIDLGAQKPQRRRRCTLPATVRRATQAQTLAMLLPQPGGPAAGFAQVRGRVQCGPAGRTSPLTGFRARF
jgi:hypothetical protein